MAIETIAVPTLISVLGVLVMNTSSSLDYNCLRDQARLQAKTLPDKTGVRARLAKLSKEKGYEHFRIRQISFSVGGAGLFAFLSILIGTSLLFTLFLGGLTGCAVYVIVDRQLTREVIRYRRTVESEFASIIEMLTLALSAGETPLGALTRVSQRCHGFLASEFGVVIDSVRSGMSFYESLDALGRRVDSVLIRRFVDSLVTAMMRGTPLVEVLQSHAAEARQNQRNILMDKAGKAEMSMMVPVVFLILPISVLFALWPSLTHLNLFAA